MEKQITIDYSNAVIIRNQLEEQKDTLNNIINEIDEQL